MLVQQALVLLIPILGVLYPLLRGSPKLFRWFESRRVYGLYSELRLLEEELASDRSHKADANFLERLDQLEDRASHLWVPASLRPQLYDLRLHIIMVRQEAQK